MVKKDRAWPRDPVLAAVMATVLGSPTPDASSAKDRER